MNVEFNEVMVELVTGDIADQPDCDAIVNAANAELRIGGGVAGAIHSVGDPELQQLTRPLAPIKPGEAVITEAPNLPNKYVIHCLGPVYGRDKPEDKLLANCYSNALTLAEENGIESIAFPAISTGAFGYPMKEAAQIAFNTVKKKTAELTDVKYIRFVLFSAADYNLHLSVLKEY
ncbi:macro domain-containing protein [Rhodohalobacter sp.]|uniref:macro domain-containing protein n=1 Tax=Rhodohalobacter sp. TaxID=1974210 RepID=UPI002ACEA1B0|nr:macro domain-containing protein [Rhodohalobacter sp.]MDZ7755536.1 macro domain-containing protein [Rhodohalobacter sp.]